MFTEQIKRHILKKLLQKGFDTTIDYIEWYGISGLSLKGFFARKTNNSQQSIYIKVLTIRISLWSSLIHLSIQGELKADNIRIDISAVSDTPLDFPHLKLSSVSEKNFNCYKWKQEISLFLSCTNKINLKTIFFCRFMKQLGTTF